MSIMYCEKHDRRWDSDRLEECPDCECDPWTPAYEAGNRIIAKHGDTFHDRDTGETLDAAAAVCRLAYGPNWRHSDEYKAEHGAESPPDALMKAAAQLERELPTWCEIHKLPGLAEALAKTDPDLQQEPTDQDITQPQSEGEMHGR